MNQQSRTLHWVLCSIYLPGLFARPVTLNQKVAAVIRPDHIFPRRFQAVLKREMSGHAAAREPAAPRGVPVVDLGFARLKNHHEGTTVSTREKLIKARLGPLALAEELQNVKLACQWAGISRSHFYEIKEAYEKYGAEGLAPQSRRRPRMPNQTPPELE
jgi:hypothetical protein